VSVALGEQLVDAGAGTDFAAGSKGSTGEQVTGLGAVDIAFEGFGVEQAANKEHFLAKIIQRSQDLAQLHLFAVAARPPFFAVKAVAREKHGQTNRGLAGGRTGHQFVAPDIERFQPGQSHGHADAAQKSAAREMMGAHQWVVLIKDILTMER
jgi:hypothetical protein